jgi:hypothetical protein
LDLPGAAAVVEVISSSSLGGGVVRPCAVFGVRIGER